jgi:hypothetical protein
MSLLPWALALLGLAVPCVLAASLTPAAPADSVSARARRLIEVTPPDARSEFV